MIIMNVSEMLDILLLNIIILFFYILYLSCANVFEKSTWDMANYSMNEKLKVNLSWMYLRNFQYQRQSALEVGIFFSN